MLNYACSYDTHLPSFMHCNGASPNLFSSFVPSFYLAVTMSWEQRNNDYDRRGNDRNVNRNNEGGLSITKSFQNNGGGYRQNNDNRNNGGYQNNRGRGGNDNYRGGNGQYNNNNNNYNNNNNRYQGGRGGGGVGGGANRADAPKKLPGEQSA